MVIAVFESVHGRESLIKCVKRIEGARKVIGYLLTEVIVQPQRVVDVLVSSNSLVDEKCKETVAYPKLGAFEEVILVMRKEFPYQAVEGFTKVGKIGRTIQALSPVAGLDAPELSDHPNDSGQAFFINTVKVVQSVAVDVEDHYHLSVFDNGDDDL